MYAVVRRWPDRWPLPRSTNALLSPLGRLKLGSREQGRVINPALRKSARREEASRWIFKARQIECLRMRAVLPAAFDALFAIPETIHVHDAFAAVTLLFVPLNLVFVDVHELSVGTRDAAQPATRGHVAMVLVVALSTELLFVGAFEVDLVLTWIQRLHGWHTHLLSRGREKCPAAPIQPTLRKTHARLAQRPYRSPPSTPGGSRESA